MNIFTQGDIIILDQFISIKETNRLLNYLFKMFAKYQKIMIIYYDRVYISY